MMRKTLKQKLKSALRKQKEKSIDLERKYDSEKRQNCMLLNDALKYKSLIEFLNHPKIEVELENYSYMDYKLRFFLRDEMRILNYGYDITIPKQDLKFVDERINQMVTAKFKEQFFDGIEIEDWKQKIEQNN